MRARATYQRDLGRCLSEDGGPAGVDAGGGTRDGGPLPDGGGGPDASGGTDGGASVDLTGSWDGTWRSAAGIGGSLSASITHTAEVVRGTADFGGSPCASLLDLAATTSMSPGATSGTLGAGTLSAPGVALSFTATYTSTRIDGTYGGSVGACGADTGTFVLSRP